MSRIRDIANILSGGSSAIATDAEISSAAAYIPSNVAGKNFIINGGMEIAQRGTSFTGNPGYNLDRWFFNGYGTGASYSVNQLLVQGVIPGLRYYQRIASTSTNVQNFFLSQSLETNEVIKFAGQTVTLSFYYRMPTNNFTGNWGVQTYYSTGTDANLHYPNPSTLITADSLSNTIYWTRFTKTFTVPVSATSFSVALNSTNNVVNAALFDITGVQLELGSVATPFSRAGGSYQGELALCQRYYYRQYAGSPYGWIAYGGIQNSVNGQLGFQIPVTMRTVPTSLEYSSIRVLDTAYAGSITSLTLQTNESTAQIADLYIIGTGYTGGRVAYCGGNNNANAYLAVSAEL